MDWDTSMSEGTGSRKVKCEELIVSFKRPRALTWFDAVAVNASSCTSAAGSASRRSAARPTSLPQPPGVRLTSAERSEALERKSAKRAGDEGAGAAGRI